MSNIPNSGASAVYTGFWIDHTEGRFLTLTNRDAAALLSFLAVAVTFAGNRSWKIWRFAIYQSLPSTHGKPEDAMPVDRRLQVILRNIITSGSTVWAVIELLWFRQSRNQDVRKCSPRLKPILLASFSAIHLAAFVAAGILTSRILIGRSVVSRKNDSCGIWGATNLDDPDQRFLWRELRLNNTLDADNYARNCYGMGVSRGILDCGKLSTPRLSYYVEHDAICPFRDLCTRPNATFAMDSGWISLHDLGVNSKFAKSIAVQRRSVCTVIPSNPFLKQIYTPRDMPTVLSGKERIYEYDFDTNPEVFWWYRNQNNSKTYDLKTVPLLIPSEQDELLQSDVHDHDLNLVLLHSHGIPFLTTHDDPWFSVHTPMEFNNSTGLIPAGYTRYETDYFLNIIACKEQTRFCSNTTSACGPWTSLYNTSLTPAASLLGTKIRNGSLEYLELARAMGIVNMVMHSTAIIDSINDRPVGSALQATRYLELGEQLRLAPQQWKLELEYWFAMALARLQLEIFNTIEKPPGVDASRAVNLWDDQGVKFLCGRIKFHSPDHSTLSAVGVMVVLVLVGVLTLVSYVDTFLGLLPVAWAKYIVAEWDKLENISLLEALEGWGERAAIWNDPLEVEREDVVGSK